MTVAWFVSPDLASFTKANSKLAGRVNAIHTPKPVRLTPQGPYSDDPVDVELSDDGIVIAKTAQDFISVLA